MFNSIYLITNQVNGKHYVGQTWKNIHRRWQHHQAQNSCIKLKRAIIKYGNDAFTIELLTITHTQTCADHWETYFIEKYDSVANGYNIKQGGSKGLGASEEFRKMTSLRMIGNTFASGRIPWNKGKHWSDAVKKKISENSARPFLGRKHTEEAKKLIGDASKARKAHLPMLAGKGK